MKILARVLVALALGSLALGPALAADKPLVLESGKLKQLPSATTLQINASGTGAASINVPHGTAPTSPNDGDIWTTTTGLYARISGSTVGPFGTGTGSGTVGTSGTPASGNLAKFSGSSTVTNGDLAGDVTTSGTLSTTIASGAVSLSKMANLSANSIIGNNTGSPATPLALSASQVKTLLAISSTDVSGLGTAATLGTAVASDVEAGTSTTKLVTPSALAGSAAVQTLTDGTTISWDMSLGYNAKVTIAGNRTLNTPTNPIQGLTYTIAIIQDSTGSRTMTWPASFDWGTTGAPTLTTSANKVDQITLFCTDAATPKFRAYLSGKGFSS